MREKGVNAWHRKRIGGDELCFVVLLGDGVVWLDFDAAKRILVPPNTNPQPKIVARIDDCQ